MISIRIDNKGFSTGATSASIENADNTIANQKACKRAVNYRCLTSGRASKRRGAKCLATVPNAVRMVPYQVTLDATYALCFSVFDENQAGGEIHIFDGSQQLQETLEHQYTKKEIQGLQYAQYKNFLVLCVATREPSFFLQEVGGPNFRFEEYILLNGATRDQNRNSQIGITSDLYQSIGAVATLTAINPAFEAGMEGGVWALTEPSGTLGRYKEWEAGKNVSINTYQRFEGKLYKCITGGVTQFPPTHDRPGEVVNDGNVSWLFLNRGTGYIKLTEVISGTTARGTIQQSLPPTITTRPGSPTNPGTPTTRWNEGAYSALRGFPVSVSFFAGRTVFAKDNRIDASKVNDIFNFDTADGSATDAASLEVSADRAAKISWLLSADRLLIGTQGGIFPVDSITPEGIQGRRNIADITTDRMKGVYLNNRALYMDFSRNILKTTVFFETNDSFLSQSLSTDAEEYVYDVKEMHAGQAINDKVYLLRGDGTLAVQQFDLLREVMGLHELVFSRNIDSMCVLQARDFERVYLLSGEDVALYGSEKYPYLDFWQDVNESPDLDQYDGKRVFVASQNAEGVNAVEKEIKNFSPTNPGIPSTPAAFTCYIGEPYTASLLLIRPSVSGGGQKFGYPVVRGQMKEIYISYENTQELEVNGYESIAGRRAFDSMDEPPPEITGTSKFALNNDILKPVELSSPSPLSCTVLFYSLIYEAF